MPVTFIKVAATVKGNKVKVDWTTGSEEAIKNYTVERSADGISFTGVGTVSALNAATGANYQWLDNQPLNGINFYRIRSNEMNGQYKNNSIVTVQLNGTNDI